MYVCVRVHAFVLCVCVYLYMCLCFAHRTFVVLAGGCVCYRQKCLSALDDWLELDERCNAEKFQLKVLNKTSLEDLARFCEDTDPLSCQVTEMHIQPPQPLCSRSVHHRCVHL